MGGEPAQRNAVAGLPEQHLGRRRAVLRRAVAAVGIVIAAAVRRRLEAEVQGHVVERAHRAGPDPHRDITESRHPRAESPLPVRHQAQPLSRPIDQQVIAGLVVVVGMGGLEQLHRVLRRDHGFVQHDQRRLVRHLPAPVVAGLSQPEVAGIGGPRQLARQLELRSTGRHRLGGQRRNPRRRQRLHRKRRPLPAAPQQQER